MFCKTIKTRLKWLIQRFDKYLLKHIETALAITTAMKELLGSPAAILVTALIPGEWDDILRKQLLFALEVVTDTLLIEGKCRQSGDAEEKIKCYIELLRQLPTEMQDALLQKFASLLAAHLDGGRLEQAIYDLATQAKYTASKN